MKTFKLDTWSGIHFLSTGFHFFELDGWRKIRTETGNVRVRESKKERKELVKERVSAVPKLITERRNERMTEKQGNSQKDRDINKETQKESDKKREKEKKGERKKIRKGERERERERNFKISGNEPSVDHIYLAYWVIARLVLVTEIFINNVTQILELLTCLLNCFTLFIHVPFSVR
jgi:hypothetical protein